MKLKWNKRQWLMLGLVMSLGVAVYLNYYFTKEPILSSSTVAGEEPVSTDHDADIGQASFVNSVVSDVPKESADDSEKPVESEKDYFEEARHSRQSARDEAVRVMEEMLSNDQTDSSQKEAATAKVTAIAENILQESNIENLILAKGFEECVAYIYDDHCDVVVRSADLQTKESIQIMEIVSAQSAVPAKNIKINAVK